MTKKTVMRRHSKRLTLSPEFADALEKDDDRIVERNITPRTAVHVPMLDLPEEPQARVRLPDPDCLTHPLRELDLKAAGIGSIIWATGFAPDYGWLKAGRFDARGAPLHDCGVTEVPGLYFLGLPWLSRRASPFIWGVWHDADNLAGHIAARG